MTNSSEKIDPIESDPEYAAIFEEVNKELEEIFKDEPKTLGFCHEYWSKKKALLWHKHKIDWQSPAELNPFTLYD